MARILSFSLASIWFGRTIRSGAMHIVLLRFCPDPVSTHSLVYSTPYVSLLPYSAQPDCFSRAYFQVFIMHTLFTHDRQGYHHQFPHHISAANSRPDPAPVHHEVEAYTSNYHSKFLSHYRGWHPIEVEADDDNPCAASLTSRPSKSSRNV